MTKTYTLEGLDCANCAAAIENAARKLTGISAATVNFATGTLLVDAEEGPVDDLTHRIERMVHSYEPDVAVIPHGDESAYEPVGCVCGQVQDTDAGRDEQRSERRNEWRGLFRLVAGTVVFGAGLLLAWLLSAGILLSAMPSTGLLTEETLSVGLPLVLYIAAYWLLGGDVVLRALKNIVRGRVFDENFLMSIATAGAFIIGDYPEAVAVMLFYQVGEYFQGLAVRRSRKSIAALMDIRPDYAHVWRDDALVRVSPEQVRIGDRVVVKPGEKIPLDGIVTEGTSFLDTAALTGESVPRKAHVSDEVLAGCINQNGVLTIRVTKVFKESTVAKIIELVENASSKKAPTEHFITAFSRYYTPVVVCLAALIAVLPPLMIGGGWADWVHRGLIFLVISCPCALVVSIPLGFFGGIGGASRKGVLVKGGNYLEALNNLDVVVFDKTGTLTQGVFTVSGIHPANGYSPDALLTLAASAESYSNHPIALSILKAHKNAQTHDLHTEAISPANKDDTKRAVYNEIAGHGVSVTVSDTVIAAGNAKLMEKLGVPFTETQALGTKVYVAENNVFAGCIVISDTIKPDAKAAIAALKARGVRKTVMLTGDHPQTADAVAQALGLDAAYGGLLPHEKVAKVEALDLEKRKKGKLAFVGDGINDAPVLARADIGIAMGGLGSDAAIEAADVVLMTDEPAKLAVAVDAARFTKRIVRQNIIFALGIKAIFLLLGAFGLATMWEAVFADVGVALLAVLNASRVMGHTPTALVNREQQVGGVS